MSDLVETPEDRFSRVAAHFVLSVSLHVVVEFVTIVDSVMLRNSNIKETLWFCQLTNICLVSIYTLNHFDTF